MAMHHEPRANARKDSDFILQLAPVGVGIVALHIEPLHASSRMLPSVIGGPAGV
jgi:hypothetical protein